MKNGISWIITWVFCNAIWAQQYNFVNLNVEHGLIQSQANALCQDQQGHLWIATMGGVSRFDGQHFSSFSMNDGLPSNPSTSLLCDHRGRIWIGTQNGLSCYNGLRFRNYFFSKTPLDNRVQSIAEDRRGRIWCTVRNRIFCVQNGTVTPADIPSRYKFRYLVADREGQIWAGGPDSPLFCLKQEQWHQVQLPTHTHTLARPTLGPDHRLWVLTKAGLYYRQSEQFVPYNPPGMAEVLRAGPRRMAVDHHQQVWIATNEGLFQIRPEGARRFNQYNGFSQNLVMDILIDREKQLWFAMAGGDGIFRYAGDTFERYDASSGLPMSSVMSIGRDSAQQLWIGTYGGGLCRLGKKGFENLRLPLPEAVAQRINSLITDHQGTIWVGTEGLGLWTHRQGRFGLVVQEPYLTSNTLVLHLHQDHRHRIWMGTSQGVLRYENGQLTVVRKAPFVSTCFLSLSKDTVLMGSTNGVYLVQHNKVRLPKQPPLLRKSTIICAVRQDNQIWIGSDNGLFCWDIQRDTFRHFSQKTGLPSNIVYNLSVGPDGVLYAGTGQGFTRLIKNPSTSPSYTIDHFGSRAGIPNWESNQHAALVDRDGSIWFGTTQGLYHYRHEEASELSAPAEVLLQSVKLFSAPLKAGQWNAGLQGWYGLPQQLKLPSRKNHLSFEFLAISLRDPLGIRYQYRIKGLDPNWSALSPNNKVEYPNLPPGAYVFEVRAQDKEGQWSTRPLRYPFEIITPFYQMAWFRGGTVGLLILLGVAIQSFRIRLRSRRKRQLALLRQEEQEKVRRRTAEDFHDELGNKLTRIALLTEILQNKLGVQQPDIQKLVQQIKDNTVQLYGGARDIIWSLNPSSDNLYEILVRIRDFGVDLLADTGIEFDCEGIQPEYREVYVPIDYSRNLIMIFKEALTNCLKHAQATQVSFEIMPLGNHNWRIILRDNGQGFLVDKIKKGHGIDNMMVRAKRIEAQLDFALLPLGGTRLELRFKLKHQQAGNRS